MSPRPAGAVELAGQLVLVAGAGVSGRAAALALRQQGSTVLLVDARGGPGVLDDDRTLPAGTTLVVTSPGWRPDAPLLVAAAAAGVPVWGEVELAWRLRPWGQRWLAVTGTNGKTTTTGMLGSILAAAGRRSAVAGNIGVPLVEVVLARPAYEVLAVELSSFQLHWSSTVAPTAAAVVNVAADHLDWHGNAAAYAAAKARIWTPGTIAVYDVDDAGAAALAAHRPGAVGVTHGVPADGQLGVIDGVLTDRAFGGGPLLAAAQLALPGPHNVTNALCAAALARAEAVPPAQVMAGLLAYRPGAHRMQLVATVAGVAYVDDSKGTNPHATSAALASYDHIVWIAGGLNKGATFEELAVAAHGRVRAAVLLGRCAAEIADAMARHAAHVPVQTVSDLDNAVGVAAGLARPGDTVLLSPAAASMDMFTDYRHRGEVFAAAVLALRDQPDCLVQTETSDLDQQEPP